MKTNQNGVVIDPPETFADEAGCALRACSSLFDLFKYLKCLTRELGYINFTVFEVGGPQRANIADAIVLSNWPAELIRAYDDLGLFPHSPVIRHIRKSGLPVRWRLGDTCDDTVWSRHAPGLFREFGISTGVCFPVFHEDIHGTLGLQGDRVDISDDELIRMSLVSALAFKRICELRAPATGPREHLSPREIECLTWTAAGKTSAEIALILSLSDHTVNHYLGSATQKLGAVTRTQAVAVAIRNKLIG